MQIPDYNDIKLGNVIKGNYITIYTSEESISRYYYKFVENRKRLLNKVPHVDCEPLTGYTKYAYTEGRVTATGIHQSVVARSSGEFVPEIKDWLEFMVKHRIPEEVLQFGSSGGCFISNMANKKVEKLGDNFTTVMNGINIINERMKEMKNDVLEVLNAIRMYIEIVYNEVEVKVRSGDRSAILYGSKRPESGTGLTLYKGQTVGDIIQNWPESDILKLVDDSRLLMRTYIKMIQLWIDDGNIDSTYVINVDSPYIRNVLGTRSDVDREDIVVEGMTMSEEEIAKTREINILAPASAVSNGNISEVTKQARRSVYEKLSEILKASVYPPDMLATESIIRIKYVTVPYEIGGNGKSVDLGVSINGVNTPADLVFPSMVGVTYSGINTDTLMVGNPSGSPITQLIYTLWNILVFRGWKIKEAMVLGDDAHIVFESKQEVDMWLAQEGTLIKNKGTYADEVSKLACRFILGDVVCRNISGDVYAFKVPKLKKSETSPKQGTSEESGNSTWKRDVGTGFNIEQIQNEETLRAFINQYHMVKPVFFREGINTSMMVESNPSLFAQVYKITGSYGDLIRSYGAYQ